MIRRILLSVCFILLICLQTSCSSQKNVGQFTITNNSDEIIKLAHIEICEQIIDIKNISPSKEHKGSFIVKSDSHYDVTITFASGKTLSKELGYVTHGFDFNHVITVTGNDITISESGVK